MKNIKTIPSADGYYMPAEYACHKGCILIWPQRPGSWKKNPEAAEKAFCAVMQAIAESEAVYLACGKAALPRAKAFADEYNRQFQREISEKKHFPVVVFEAETDDAWARDIGPTFVVKDDTVRGISWTFNAWGGEEDGLYASWQKDDAFAAAFAKREGYVCYDASPFVLEGGSIHSDGEGTVMVTESCLLSRGRNPQLSKAEIEEKLQQFLGAEKVLWLPRGIYNDETNEHVDNVCAFIRPGEVVLAWTDREDDPQYPLSLACLRYLESKTDARGRRIKVHKLPIPDVPVCVTKEDLEGYAFEDGEDTREEGERLAASYVNFYFSNGAVVMPAFGGENIKSDQRAAEIMEKLCPERKVITVDARDILTGGGNIHCITQQIPFGKAEQGE